MTPALSFVVLTLAATGFAQTPPPQQAAPANPPATQQTVPPLVPAHAPAPGLFPADAKIAFVSMQTIVAQSNLGKAGQKQVQALQDKTTAELSARSKVIQTLQREIAQRSNVLSAAVVAGKNAELEKAQREAQFFEQDANAQIQTLNDQLLTNFKDMVLPILETLRKEKELLAIFSLENSGAVAWHPGLDLSAEVVKRLDATVKGPVSVGEAAQ